MKEQPTPFLASIVPFSGHLLVFPVKALCSIPSKTDLPFKSYSLMLMSCGFNHLSTNYYGFGKTRMFKCKRCASISTFLVFYSLRGKIFWELEMLDSFFILFGLPILNPINYCIDLFKCAFNLKLSLQSPSWPTKARKSICYSCWAKTSVPFLI